MRPRHTVKRMAHNAEPPCGSLGAFHLQLWGPRQVFPERQGVQTLEPRFTSHATSLDSYPFARGFELQVWQGI
eukprot:15458716-Alexandrium_andersonii.AAC.1